MVVEDEDLGDEPNNVFTMDLGSEISQQIKSAIKNKLQELGSYVDDELPEYIMVMLSNKRSKKQMTEDLMLFLGENTVKFIDWLTNLVEKLKDVASLVESAEASDQQEIPDSTPEKDSPPMRNDGKEQTSKKIGSSRDRRKSPSRSAARDGHHHHSKPSKNISSRSERSKSSSSNSSRQNTSESKHSNSKKRKLSESEEEELQVSTPLSSVVRVQEKRPTLPPSKQATGSLLRKAVAEAHMSVTKVMHSLTYDPTSPPSPKKVQSLEEKKQQKEILLQQHRELQKQLQNKELEDSTSNQEQSETEYDPTEREDTEIVQTTQENVVVDSDLINEPVIELQVSEAEADELNAELAQGDTRIVAFADSQSSATSTTEEDKHKRKRKRAVKSRDRPRSPKFIVTLDGVDSELEDKFEKRSKPKQKPKKSQSEFDDFEEIDTSNMSFAPQPEMIAPEDKPTPPAVEEVMFTLDTASDDEDGHQQMPVVSQPQEKCKFWPDCMNGPNCPFYHPSTPCRTFPNCKFADKCLFIHPLCKFDGRCANVLCPFLHKNKLKIKAPPLIKTKPAPPPPVLQIDEALPILAQITPCKFFPGCTRSNCPFLHPKPTITKVCRYGSTCSRVDCMFTHPPSKAALKWVAPSSHISERSFAVPEDKVTKTPVAS